jgi:hypothetical protein
VRRKTLGQASAVSLFALLCSAGTLGQSVLQSFAADIVKQDAGGQLLGSSAKLYAANRQTRIEMAGEPDGFFLSDGDTGMALFVRSSQRVYLDARRSSPLTRIFVRVDPRDPCRQWRAAAAIAGEILTDRWRCEPLEHQLVNGREVIEYRVLTPDGRSSFGWVDSALAFPVKWQSADGKIFALENIMFQALPASLFSIPSGYRKLDPRALLERIKHSDVWAEPPK